MLIRFILFILFFYLIYFMIKYLFLKPFRNGYRQKGRERSRGFEKPFSREKEGDVSITYNPNQKKNGEDKLGEYVDYEEVKE